MEEDYDLPNEISLWIEKHVRPRKNLNYYDTARFLAKWCSRSLEFPVTEQEMYLAMAQAGYEPEWKARHWSEESGYFYRISYKKKEE